MSANARAVMRGVQREKGSTAQDRQYAGLSIASVVAGLAVWHVISLFTNPLFLVGPWETVVELGNLVTSGEYFPHLWLSGQEFLYGFGLSILIGVPLGLAMAVSRRVEAVVEPWAWILNATPRLALGPLIILWLGIGIWSKIVLVFLGAVFPILINTYVGAKDVDAQMRLAARAFGASRREQFMTILIPGALPHIISGLRLGAIQGILGVLVGEFFGSRGGIGNMIFAAAQTFETAKMLVGIVTFAVAGLAVSVGLRWLEDWLAPWRRGAER